MEAVGAERGPVFYEAALGYAQSLWRQGFPAKSLLLCNRALMADVSAEEPVLTRHPLPYKAVAWLLQHRQEGQFIGNPRRHYQHLATRMIKPRLAQRVWRAWACWYLAKELLPENEFPADEPQIRAEGVVEPTRDEIARELRRHGGDHDATAWHEALDWCQPRTRGRPDPATTIRIIKPAELPLVCELAQTIWHQVYPGIITPAQIEYMLARFYQPELMAEEMLQRRVCYALIEIGGKPAGYLSFEPLAVERTAFLHKLYLLPQFHDTGAGALALAWVEQAAKLAGLRAVKLRVNKHNARAIRAYLRRGFRFAGDEVSDIGGGFVMDDYWMEKPLA